MNVIKKLIIIFIFSIITIFFIYNISLADTAQNIQTTNITNIKVTKVSLNRSTLTLTKGKAFKLLANIKPTNATNKSLIWSTSNSKVATVTAGGTVKGISKGTATITAKTKDGSGIKTICKIKINPVTPTSVSLNTKNCIVPVGTHFQLKSTILPQNTDNKTIKWTTSNSKIATITQYGKVSGKSVGKVTITATTHNGKKATCLIRVNIPAKSIKLNTKNLNLPVGGKETLSVSFTPTNASSKSITWTSSNPNIVTIPNTKKSSITITTKREGTSIITATSQYGLKTSCTIKVTKALKTSAGFRAKAYNSMKYYESIPKNATENLPLIIFLHGDGEVNKFSKLRTLPIIKYVESNTAFKAGNFIFIAPMRTTSTWKDSNTEKKLINLIKKTVAYYKIDKKRIILTGMSSGGQGTWHLASKYPYYFAALVPMSAKTRFAKAEKLVNIPIWGICGDTKDKEPERNRQMKELITKLNKLNGSKKIIKFETIHGATHSTIQKYFNRQELFKWMLAQRKK